MKITFKNIDYKKPLKGFHSRSRLYGRDNSIETFDRVMDYDPEMVEVDLRKSRDGILYGYHDGRLSWFLRFFKFSTIRKLLKVNTLKEILGVINRKGSPAIFIDIKQGNISIEDLDNICLKFDFEYLLQFITAKKAGEIKSRIKNQPYIVNWYCPFGFYSFEFRFKRTKKYNLDMFELFWSECNDENIEKIQKEEMIYYIRNKRFQIFRTDKNNYERLLNKYGLPFFLFNDLDDLTHYGVRILD